MVIITNCFPNVKTYNYCKFDETRKRFWNMDIFKENISYFSLLSGFISNNRHALITERPEEFLSRLNEYSIHAGFRPLEKLLDKRYLHLDTVFAGMCITIAYSRRFIHD